MYVYLCSILFLAVLCDGQLSSCDWCISFLDTLILLCALSTFAFISLRKTELVVLLNNVFAVVCGSLFVLCVSSS